MTFIEVHICYRKGSLRLLYSVTLTTTFKDKHFMIWIWSKKIHRQPMSTADLPRLARLAVLLLLFLPKWQQRLLRAFSCVSYFFRQMAAPKMTLRHLNPYYSVRLHQFSDRRPLAGMLLKSTLSKPSRGCRKDVFFLQIVQCQFRFETSSVLRSL